MLNMSISSFVSRLGHALVAPPSSSADFYDDHESVMND